MTVTLILGGARSGKSLHAQNAAEQTAAASGQTPLMIVTAQAFDDEMRARIDQHRQDRGARWRTLEAPHDLAGAISSLGPDDIAVVDCLTLWLSNLMLADADLAAAFDELEGAITTCPARLWLVSNEVGWGVVPDNPLGRRFRDEAGRLHQRLAARAANVSLIVAGLPLRLKGGAA